MESWFSTLKCELGERFDSYGRAKEELFDYVEVFYNRRRRHSSLEYLSPEDFERRGRETPTEAWRTTRSALVDTTKPMKYQRGQQRLTA